MNGEKMVNSMFPCFSHIVDRICTPGWRIPKETYQKHNLILIYGGEAVFSCNGRQFRGTRGDLVYFKPGDLRWAGTVPDKPMQCFAVDFIFTCLELNDGRFESADCVLPFGEIEKISDNYLLLRLLDLFGELARIWISRGENSIIRCRSVFMEIMSLLTAWKSGSGMNYDKLRKVEKLINYMAGNYSKQISLIELSNLCQVSPSYIGAVFREVTGKTPIGYLIEIRMSKAKELIRDGYQIAEVAQKVGFNDIFYFSKCFKKLEGVPPSCYKRKDQRSTSSR